MKKKLLWTVVILLVLATAWRLSWPRFLPVERMYGDPELPESFEEMVNRAELIVLADIKSVKQGPDYLAPIIGTDSIYREPTQRVTLEVVKVYKGDVAQGQSLTLFQGSVGVTQSIQDHPWPVFRINENDPVYTRGERYILMLSPVPISEEIKPYQPERWQEGMFSVSHPGRMRLNADGTVTSVLNSFSINGKTLQEIEERITATIDSLPKYNLEQAREALLTYFSLLHSQRYDEAIYFYGGSYDLLRDWNPTVDPNDYIALFKNGCTINGLMCLEVWNVVQEEQISSDGFKFIVEFMNEDGSLFVSGPDTSPQSQFTYTVQKVDSRFLIQGRFICPDSFFRVIEYLLVKENCHVCADRCFHGNPHANDSNRLCNSTNTNPKRLRACDLRFKRYPRRQASAAFTGNQG